MAKFLNSPHPLPLLDGKFGLTQEPLLFQWAGPDVPKELVTDYLKNWNEPNAWKDFLNKLPEDVQIWKVPPGKVTDGPSMPGYAAMAAIGAAIGGVLAQFGLQEYFSEIVVALAGLVAILRRFMNPLDFYLSGVLHDDLRVKCSTGNATTDGFLRDAATAEANWILRAYLVYLGVRTGTLFGYKTKIKEKIQKEALNRYAKLRKVDVNKLWFDEEHSEIRYVIEDPIQSLA